MTEGTGPEQDAATERSARPDEPKNQEGERKKKRWNVWQRLSVIVAAIVFIGLVILSIPDLLSGFSGSAAENFWPVSPAAGKTVKSSVGASRASMTAKLRPGQREEVDFGRSMTSRSVTLYLDLSNTISEPTHFHVVVNPFTRVDGASLRGTPKIIIAPRYQRREDAIAECVLQEKRQPE
jgi:hypothetical protein